LAEPRPEYRALVDDPATIAADVLFIPVFGETDTLADLAWLVGATGGEIPRARSTGEFASRLYEIFATPAGSGSAARRVALVGAGNPADASAERLRRLGAACGYSARKFRVPSAAFLIRGGLDPIAAAQHIADGFVSTEFEGASYRQDPASRPPVLGQVLIVGPGTSADALDQAVQRGRVISESANFTRALANEPANVLPPSELARRIVEAAQPLGLKTEVIDEQGLAKLGMNLLLGVGQGSASPPRLIIVRHEPAGAPDSPVIGLIGKGVTFDTGGVSIKPAEGMERMKSDMSGAAAVAAAMLGVARLGGKFKTIGVIPSAENMVGGNAIRPGDVLRGASGKTVEVINTDAEGRLILGDALWYAKKLGCTHLVDVATLTGAVTVALGRHVTGLLGQPQEWIRNVAAMADVGGDRVWQLPIYEEAKEQLRSEIADIVNSAGRPGGTITAAAFLREFAGNGPWAHLDIAGTAWAETKEPYQPKGATGVAVRTLIEVAMTGGVPRR
jgi:leucyl aminopeptidase